MNDDIIVTRLHVCRGQLKDLFDTLVDSKCNDPSLMSAVSTSLCLISSQYAFRSCKSNDLKNNDRK